MSDASERRTGGGNPGRRAPRTEEFGPYIVYERLGQGGMATVHRAEKRGVGIRRPIALKRLLAHAAADPELVKLFVDEARLASHLRHANVAQTYELGKVGDTYFIAMEYASGPTLSQIMRQAHKAGFEIPLTVTVNILAQVCDALDYAHNLRDEFGQPLQIIHRDVSPGNIIVTSAGVVKLIDFGIAKATISSVKTQAGFIKGKFGYIAPEYLTGQIDSRVDLFAVGVVAHELLAGRRLFEGQDDFETLANIRELAIQPPSAWNPHVPDDLDDIVMTALVRDPAKRWQSAGAMQVALANIARELGIIVGSPQLSEWLEWAFGQLPDGTGAAGAAGGATAGAAGTPAHVEPRAPARGSAAPASQVAEPDVPLGPYVPLRAPSPSDFDETAPLERVRIDFNAPPSTESVLPAILRSPAAARPRLSKALAAVAPTQPMPPVVGEPPRPARNSRGYEAVAPTQPMPMPTGLEPGLSATLPQPQAPPQTSPTSIAAAGQPPQRRSRSLATVTPVIPAREIEVIAVPAGSMFAEPLPDTPPSVPVVPEPTRPPVRKRARTIKPEPAAAAAPMTVAPAVAPAASPRTASSPRSARRIIWLVLLMLLLGAGAAAAAYYWPMD